MSLFISQAHANTAAPAAGGFELMSFLPMIVIFVLFWLLLVRPQQKRAKQQQAMLSALQKGDEVATQSGMIGRIVKVDEQFITLQVADNVELQFQRATISSKLEKGTFKL